MTDRNALREIALTFLCVFLACVLHPVEAQSADSLHAPLRLKVMADPGSGSVNLTWVENNTKMSGYQIERAQGDNRNFAPVGRTREYTAGFSDSTAVPGQDYVYRVRAFLDDTLGPPSEEVKVGVPALGATTYTYKPFAPSTAAPISAFVPSTVGRPYFRRHGTATQLMVDGQPFLALSGQLENNTIGFPRDLDKLDAVLDICQQQNQNTVEIPIQWRALEPEEGKFDFTVVDALIKGCRKRDLKLVILWFGSWKNSESYFAPPWLINNTQRFFRAQKRHGGNHGMVSAFCEEACQADIKAFTTLMRHILETDSKDHTVVLVQVENETGMFAEESRDLSGPAQAAFTGLVPAKLMRYLIAHKGKLRPHLEKLWAMQGCKEKGTWTEVFGPSIWADEVFMAWQVAQYVERVAVAGKAVYPLPMYANAWLDGDGKPGDYPTGGPVAKMRDLWRAAAPSLDALSPDIYGPEFQDVCSSFNVDDNPMLVPEAYYYEPSAVAPFYAFGEANAMLFGSYYIEGYGWGDKAPAPGQLHPVKETFAVLREMAPVILEHQGNQSMTGFFQVSDDEQFNRTLNGYKLEMAETRPVYGRGKSAGGSGFLKGQVPGGAMVIAVAPDEFVVVGRGLKVSFAKADGPAPHVISAASGHYTQGVWNQEAVVQMAEPAVKLPDDKIEVLRVKFESLNYKVSWLGNSFSGASNRWVQNFFIHTKVQPDGTVNTWSHWDEGGKRFGVYKDGDVIGNTNVNPNSLETVDRAGHRWRIAFDYVEPKFHEYDITPKGITCDGEAVQFPGLFEPMAIALANDGQLMVADSQTSPRQQVLFYDITNPKLPKLTRAFGEYGGIASGKPGEIPPTKFWGIRGIGMDAAGNLYVAMSEMGSSLRKFSPEGKLLWELRADFFVDVVCADPTTDGRDVWGIQEHYVMDYTKPPGQESKLVGYSLDRHKYPHDPRGLTFVKQNGEHGLTSPQVVYLNGHRFLYVGGMFASNFINIFRYDDEIAVPCGLILQWGNDLYRTEQKWPPNKPKGTSIWRDLNGDGQYQAEEFMPNTDRVHPGPFWVDKKGNIWMAYGFFRYDFQGVDSKGNPIYTAGKTTVLELPEGVKKVARACYLDDTDTLVVADEGEDMRHIGRVFVCKGYLGGNRKTVSFESGAGKEAECVTAAGEYAFTGGWKERGRIHVNRLSDGAEVGVFDPGPTVGGVENTGWVDILTGITAFRRNNDEYLVFVEEDYKAKVLMYRWHP